MIGIGSYSFRWAIGTKEFRPSNPLTPFDLIDRTVQLGCGLLQIADNTLLDQYERDQLLELRSYAKCRNVELEIGTSGANESRIRKYLEIAKRLEIKVLRLVLDGNDLHPTLGESLSVLSGIVPSLRQAGITLAIENHFLIASSDLLNLVRAVDDPAIGICLDVANSIACQEWPLETASLLGPYAVNVHLKDFAIYPHPDGTGVVVTGAPLGEGSQNIPELLNRIPNYRRLNFILEQWLPRQLDESTTLRMEMEWVERSVANAKKYLE